MKLMQADDIPAFVDEIIKGGCDICAGGHDSYVLGDIEEMAGAEAELERIDEACGDRDFLKLEIVAYLCSRGRHLDVGSSATQWTENRIQN